VVRGAVELSRSLGIHETIIGLTIVAAGTSVPDVFATFTALRRKEYEIGVGNILGSNISNIIIVLGTTLVVSGRSLGASVPLVVDYVAVVASAAVFTAIVLATQRVTRLGGALLVLFFAAYMGIRVAVTL
jgi:cation:H+ antiporter